LALLERVASRPRLAAVAGAFVISFSGIFYRWSEVSPSTGVVFRCFYGLPLLVLAERAESRRLGPMDARTLRLSALAGLFFAVDLLSFHYSVNFIGAGLATVMGNFQVLFVALAAWALFGERPSRGVLLALPLMLTGVVLISGILGTGAYGANAPLGVAIGLVTAASYAAYLLVIRRASRERRSAGPVAVATAVTGAVAVLFGLVAGDLDLVPALPAHAYLLALGVLSQSIGYLVIQSSLPRLPAAITSVLLMVQPVATVLLGAMLLGERPSLGQLGGVVLVIGGIAVATGARRRIRGTLARPGVPG
jgi:drug/metabolite transporter (DMT)-like permease